MVIVQAIKSVCEKLTHVMKILKLNFIICIRKNNLERNKSYLMFNKTCYNNNILLNYTRNKKSFQNKYSITKLLSMSLYKMHYNILHQRNN